MVDKPLRPPHARRRADARQKGGALRIIMELLGRPAIAAKKSNSIDCLNIAPPIFH